MINNYYSDLYYWIEDEPNSRWEKVARDSFTANMQDDIVRVGIHRAFEDVAEDHLHSWLLNGEWKPGDYRCEIRDTYETYRGSAESEHTTGETDQ